MVKTFCTETAKRLHAYLNSRDVKNKLLNWEPNEMPKTKSAKLEEELEKKIRERVETEIGLWKTNDETFRNELDKIRGKCSKLCEGIKNDMDKINRMIEGAGDIVDLPKKRIKEQDGLLDGFIDKSAGLKAAALITAPIWLPAALVVGMFIIPIWGIGSVTKAVATDIKDTHRRASQRRQYEHNMHKYIENFTSDFLREQITEQCLTDTIIKKQNESYLKAVDTLYKVTIPQRLETNRRFLKTIMKEGATSKETKAMFRPVRECLKGILTQMTKLRIQFLVNPCFAKRDIEIQSTISSRSKIDEIQFPVNHSNRKAAVKTIHLSDMEKLQEADRLL